MIYTSPVPVVTRAVSGERLEGTPALLSWLMTESLVNMGTGEHVRLTVSKLRMMGGKKVVS